MSLATRHRPPEPELPALGNSPSQAGPEDVRVIVEFEDVEGKAVERQIWARARHGTAGAIVHSTD